MGTRNRPHFRSVKSCIMKKILEYFRVAYQWIRVDGLLHIMASAIFLALLGWIRPFWIPMVATFLIGAGKETYDLITKKGTAEWHDIICDVIGIVLGGFIVYILMGF